MGGGGGGDIRSPVWVRMCFVKFDASTKAFVQ
jgi:hypothetical protein